MKTSFRPMLSALRAAWAAPLLAGALAAQAQPVATFHLPPGTTNPSYSEAVEVKGAGLSTLYVSSLVPAVADPTAAKEARAYFGDMQVQTDGLLKRLKALLERRGYSLRDVVKVNVYLVGDPARGHQVDNEGFNAAYARHFGTAEVPTLPARTRITAAGLTNPAWLIALDVVAAR